MPVLPPIPKLQNPTVVPLGPGSNLDCRQPVPLRNGAPGAYCHVAATHVVAWDETRYGARARCQSPRCRHHTEMWAAAQDVPIPTVEELLRD